MSQLMALVFYITREAARWIYETMNQGISIVINSWQEMHAVPRLPAIYKDFSITLSKLLASDTQTQRNLMLPAACDAGI